MASETSPSPKILLAKPGLVAGGPVTGKFSRGGAADDEAAQLRSRLPSVASLNLLSDSWDFHIDRFLPFLTENTDFTVIGVIGPSGAGKSTIMNEIYGFDSTSPGMLPPFSTQSEETRAMARHCSTGIEPRVSSERIILLDTQADLLKHGIPDPSLPASSLSQSSNLGLEKDYKVPEREEYMATPVFVHSKLHDQDFTPKNVVQLRRALLQYFKASSFAREHTGSKPGEQNTSHMDSGMLNMHAIPFKQKEENPRARHESYISALWKLRDQILSMKPPSFTRPVSEREWLKNSVKIWEQIKSSPTILDYCRTLQHSGMFRR